MSNPEKRWSWGGAMGRSTGPGMAGVASGALAGHLGGPLGVPVGAALFGAIGFAGGFVGAVLGHWWDQMERPKEEFGSGVLFTLVVSGVLDFIFVLLAAGTLPRASNPVMALSILIGGSSLLSAASKSLLDDLHATYVVAREKEKY